MTVLSIPVPKAKANVSVDTEIIPEANYAFIFIEGLKLCVNKGMTKNVQKGLSGVELEKAQADALETATKNVEAILHGVLKSGRTKSIGDKVPAAVMTEARRLAKILIKDQLKAAGKKVSYIPASEITAAANAYLNDEMGAKLIEQAKENLDRLSVAKPEINVSAISEDPKLVAKAEKAKADKKKDAPLSAKQAGMTTKAKKGQHATTAH